MTFRDLATKIVKDSIRTAICIDDQFLEPYEEIQEGFEIDLPKRMYNSFKEEGKCTLDFYRYKSKEQWLDNSEFVLSNRDLVILDWELEKVDPKYQNTLYILEDIIRNGSNQFVIIYTHLERLDGVLLNINSFYNRTNIETSSVKIEAIVEKFEETGAEFEDLNKAIQSSISQEDIFSPQVRLSSLLKDAGLEGREIGMFLRSARTILDVKSDEEVLEFLILNQYKLRDYTSPIQRNLIKVEGERIILNIDNTIVFVSNKSYHGEDGGKIVPEELFNVFTEAIIQKPNNAMTLMACNLKDLFRSNIAHIGFSIPQIDEKAFFHHWRNLRKEEDVPSDDADDQFKHFLLQTWSNELSQFTLKASGENTFFEALEKYGNEKALLADAIDNNASIDELIKLGAHYSTININDNLRADKKIQFGDIFWKQDSSTTMNEVLLSITPHCDSIRPSQKISNMLHFVRGKVLKNGSEIEKALGEAETNYYSFLNIENTPICIEWFTKPFSIYIEEKHNDVSKLIDIEFKKVPFRLKHITLLKENYTQRIANHSFSHAMRVGITLPSLKN